MSTLKQRLWSKVDQSGGPDACWPWVGGWKDARGYGLISRGRRGEGNTRAHRVALELSGVEVPKNRHVLHSCDNPPCCNPAHLRVGTDLDNVRDAIERGRHSPPPHYAGERNQGAKLTTEQVREVRRHLAAGATGRELARRYGVSPSAISLIKRGKKWSTVQ